MEDEQLLIIYMHGFNDELSQIYQQNIYNDLEQIAYNLGRTNAIVGDDISSVDLQTNDEILTRIKNELQIIYQ